MRTYFVPKISLKDHIVILIIFIFVGTLMISALAQISPGKESALVGIFVYITFFVYYFKWHFPTSGFTGPYITCDYCYGASPQNPRRYTSGDPWRWADPNGPNGPNDPNDPKWTKSFHVIFDIKLDGIYNNINTLI